MLILIAGASGFVGYALATRLLHDGHALVCASRRPGNLPDRARHLRVDFSSPPGRDWWAPHLDGVDVVVNAVGIFREGQGQTFDALHTRAPVELFEAAANAGVRLVVQLSALGADDEAATAFHASKYRADEALRRLPVRSVVVQPSLVYASRGTSATLFNQLALLPLVPLPAIDARVQPVHLDDVVEALVHLIHSPPARSCTIAAVGPQAVTLKEYLAVLRQALGSRRAQWVLSIPMGLAAMAVHLMALLRPGLVDASALDMLARGNQAPAADFARCLGRAPRPIAQFLGADDKEPAREHAQLHTWLGVMKAALAAVWIVTGLLSLGLYPVERSLALLQDFGLRGAPAVVALYAGAVLDLALGLALALAPPRQVRWVLCAQFATMAGYTILITLRISDWWLHPFGPILKNLPMLAATAMLMALHRRH